MSFSPACQRRSQRRRREIGASWRRDPSALPSCTRCRIVIVALARLGEASADIGIAAQRRRQPLAQQRDHAAQIVVAPHRRDLARRAADAAARAGDRIVAVDHEAQRIGRPRIVQRRDRHRAAAIALAVDRDRRQSRQRGARQHVIGAEHVAVVVEIGLGSGCQVDRAEDEPDRAGIDPLEIDRRLHQLAQLAGPRPRPVARGGTGARRASGPAQAGEPKRRSRRASAARRPRRGAPAQLLPELAQPRARARAAGCRR